MGRFDFALAGLATHSRAIRNLFPKDQADRLEVAILKIIDSPEHGEYAVGEIRAYHKTMLDEEGGDPRDVIAAASVRLLRKWLGDGMRKLVDPSGIVSPLAVMVVMSAILDLGGMYWKTIKERAALDCTSSATEYTFCEATNWSAGPSR
jgi:hypothetical protein